ncbi:MAG TPA: glucosaminidase domain-containing protein, partial [Bacteroidia bacterium]|nr:glucosaminidase domain-containing protein [Bacteroidia bacterium]
MKKFSLFFTLLFCNLILIAQPAKRATIPEYIAKYKDDAIKDMMKMGVPASITLSQGILESESGNSLLAKNANNHFGIKCHSDWNGETFHQDDDARDECFRKYSTVLESFDDHGRFLRERPRYSFLFDLEISDYKSWAHGLKKAGYATNPRYAELLIKIIEEYNLHQFDKGGKKIPVIPSAAPLAATQPAKQKPAPSAKPA